MEKNQASPLQAALRRLPDYDPPAEIWSQIEKTLEPASPAQPSLPEYDPPADLWPRIESGLHRPLRHTRRRALLLAAAALALLLVARYHFRNQREPAAAAVRYSQEVLYDAPPLPAANQTDKTRQLLDTLCRKHPKRCLQPDFLQMKAELEELAAAQSALAKAIGRYDNDPTLRAELARIERAQKETTNLIIGECGLQIADF
ncbi:MAG: hypothetical protein ACR2K1_01620 [Saprospiraceae bacterium]